MPKPPIITLTTDFGTSDHFVGAMKGVIAGIAPQARVVDITHEVAAYDILDGAFVIVQAWSSFPKGTIHVVVVDPGVGSERRPILAEAGGHVFIAPDNGVLSMVFDAAKPKVRVISNTKYMAREVSRTFHGRDIFAQVAAHLAKGATPASVGKLIQDCARIDAQPCRISPHVYRGMVLKADRFGNLITNFHVATNSAITAQPFELRIADRAIRRLALTFSDAPAGELVAIVGSSGYVEIAANQSSAAKILGCGSRTPVDLEFYVASGGSR